MNDPLFVAGQRWISTTELELGLGIVADVSPRHVRLLFPAAGEERLYAKQNAPLTRLTYEVDDQVADLEGARYRIVAVMEEQGRHVYRVCDERGEESRLPEQLLDSHVVIRRPQERLFSGQIDRNASFELRAATLEQLHRLQSSDAYGLLGPRVQLLPHQLYIAAEVASRPAPRVLLADEVGLGKTIEAGLVLHQLLVRGRAERVLVVVPESLVHQWLVEMLRRFNLRFSVFDRERIEALASEGNPFATAQLVIVSLDLLTDQADTLHQAMEADWDLMVVDEAHHLGWQEGQASLEYRCVEGLAAKIPGLLLLTATPEQLGRAGHFARLRLLDPDRYPSLAEYLQEEAGYASVAAAAEQLSNYRPGQALPEAVCQQLEDDLLQLLVDTQGGDDFASARRTALQRLIDRHGTGRVLFRNTRDTVTGFPSRQLVEHPLDAPPAYAAATNATLSQQLHPELLLGEDWLTDDPRVSWLVDWLAAQTGKILLICARAETARQLEGFLRLQRGVRSAVFHEQMTLLQRDRAAAFFGDPDYGADILICSEIGSEGRNFQFAHQLVLFDLPLNPDLLEQRIGRLDRIGQTQTVMLHTPYFRATAQERLLRWLNDGLDALLTPCVVGPVLFGEQREALEESLSCDADREAFDALVSDTRGRAEALRARLAAGRNKLLELSACDPEEAGRLLAELETAQQEAALRDYIGLLFDHYGIDYQEQADGHLVIRPGEQMLTDALGELTEEGLSGTLDRATALQREDLAYLTWEHPLVAAAMELVAETEAGNSAVCTLKLPALKPGTLLLEMLFRLRIPAPKGLQLQRYLPAAAWRIVLNVDGQDLGGALPAAKLNPLLSVVPPEVAVKLVRHAKPQLTELVRLGEQRAEKQQQAWIDRGAESVRAEMASERARLVALQAVNPSVSPEEVAMLERQEQTMLGALSHAQLQLDALRMVVVTA